MYKSYKNIKFFAPSGVLAIMTDWLVCTVSTWPEFSLYLALVAQFWKVLIDLFHIKNPVSVS